MTEWPRDSAGNVFLAMAVLLVGKAFYGDAWTGFEHLVAFEDHKFPKPEYHFIEEIGADEEQKLRTLIDAKRRFEHVQSLIVSALANNKLSFALRRVEGGAFIKQRKEGDVWPKDVGSELWNIDSFKCRFAYCQLTKDDPYSGKQRGDHYIFVDETSLQNFVAGLSSQPGSSSSPSPSGDASKLAVSEYLHIMLETCAKLGCMPDAMPVKDSVEEELKAIWKSLYPHLPYSTKLADSMATLCRDFSSQAGRGKKNGGGPFRHLEIKGLSNG